MKTMSDLVQHHGLVPDAAVFADIAADLEIPVYDRLQLQGDLAFLPITGGGPVRAHRYAEWTPVPQRGVELLTGDGGHTHRLVADPGVARWTTNVVNQSQQTLGVIDADAPVYVQHEEHGALGLAAGQWVVRRQVEWAEQQRRMVAD